MKKIELNEHLRKVLVVITWLLSLSVISTLGVSGTGFFGALTFYAGILFLAFVYFKDQKLQSTVVKSMLTAFIFVLLAYVSVVLLKLDVVFEINSDGFNKLIEVYSLAVNVAQYVIYGIIIIKELSKKEAVKAEVKEEPVQKEIEE